MRTTAAFADRTPQTRERILEAALLSFANNGYEGATTREIAKHAGVPQGLLRYHFGGKLPLWKAAVDRAFGEVRAGLEAAQELPSDKADPIEAIRRGIRAHIRYVAAHPEFVRLMHAEGKRRSPRMRWIVDRHVSPMFERLEALVRRLQALERLPGDIAPLHFVYALIGAIDVIFHQAEECRRVTGVDPTDPAVVEAHARVVELMFLGRSSADPAA